ncbi:MAG: NYN domain-containing protein [Deltaproteobacteria bacterium]|nr:NYN domain-containing protein [Deltaproteobacteria bacterium]
MGIEPTGGAARVEPVGRMHIIIDGYNLIRQSDSLKRFEKLSLEEGRNELIRRMVSYKRLKGHKITIVFDGWIGGSPNEERTREGGITVMYSRQGEKADEVIKRLVRKKEGEEVVVVTSDGGVVSAISRTSGVTISSPEFEDKVRMEEEEVLLLEKGMLTEEDENDSLPGTRKKGPSRRISKRERLRQKRFKKL